MKVDFSAASKAQAMFGKRLRFQDYQELAKKANVAEIASYLKNQTDYDSFLEGVNEHSIHRGYLELLIRQNYFYRFSKLLRYTNDSKEFIRFRIMNVEYQLILSTIYMLNDENRSDMIARLPLRLDQYISFPMEKLVEVRSIDELLEVIRDTIYYKALVPYHGESNQDLNVSACEYSLRDVYTHANIELINNQFKGETAKELYEVFATQVELNNITRIYRLKKYYQMSPLDIKLNINMIHCKIDEKVMNDWIDVCNAEEMIEQFSQSSYYKFIKGKEFLYIENYLSWIEYQMNLWYMRYSQNPEVIIVCYLSLLQFEITNLVNIIEGVRYHVAAEKVMQLLVY